MELVFCYSARKRSRVAFKFVRLFLQISRRLFSFRARKFLRERDGEIVAECSVISFPRWLMYAYAFAKVPNRSGRTFVSWRSPSKSFLNFDGESCSCDSFTLRRCQFVRRLVNISYSNDKDDLIDKLETDNNGDRKEAIEVDWTTRNSAETVKLTSKNSWVWQLE